MSLTFGPPEIVVGGDAVLNKRKTAAKILQEKQLKAKILERSKK